MAKIRIKQISSLSGRNPVHRRTIEALGLKRIGHVVEKNDTPAIRGMINQVKHMVCLVKE